jgi:hypothetical protein
MTDFLAPTRSSSLPRARPWLSRWGYPQPVGSASCRSGSVACCWAASGLFDGLACELGAMACCQSVSCPLDAPAGSESLPPRGIHPPRSQASPSLSGEQRAQEYCGELFRGLRQGTNELHERIYAPHALVGAGLAGQVGNR